MRCGPGLGTTAPILGSWSSLSCSATDRGPLEGLRISACTGHSSGRWHITSRLDSMLVLVGVAVGVTEVLSASAWQALMESVDKWPMAITIL
jgi:hypothetical protein